MKQAIAAALLLAGLTAAADPVQPAGDFRICTADASQRGLSVVAEACGLLAVPDFSGVEFQSADDLTAGAAMRDAFLGEVAAYGQCVSELITSRLQHEDVADGYDADEAACAHAWAEDQATQVVRSYGQACIAYADRSIIDIRLPVYDGPCYPVAETPLP